MVWPFQASRSSDRDRVEEANRAIASIFSPSHVAFPDSAVNDFYPQNSSNYPKNPQAHQGDLSVGTLWLTTAQDSEKVFHEERSKIVEKVDSDSSSFWHRVFFYKTKPQSEVPSDLLRVSSSNASDDKTIPIKVKSLEKAGEGDDQPTKSVKLSELPPCPIAGYELDLKRGLVDIYRRPPHTLSIKELRFLIIELSSIEQQAKNTVDRQFGTQMNSRGLRGMELLINPCILLTGLYFMTWRTARLWQSALPRHSFILNSGLKLLRWRVPAEKKEKLAREHRRLMQATNTHLSLSFMMGLFMVGVSWVTWPSLDVMETAPEIVVGKQNVAYQNHSTASLKWLWFVYYNHPAYASKAVSILTPPILR
ncbi:unnamed protein product [Phytomonas sp. Hart1]|nr:unnamed protein product [Phytomonas sp. Hart1]|eukprot:CCW65938.1 unnamed protein product [Phytomonas sp. isolate Hart1]